MKKNSCVICGWEWKTEELKHKEELSDRDFFHFISNHGLNVRLSGRLSLTRPSLDGFRNKIGCLAITFFNQTSWLQPCKSFRRWLHLTAGDDCAQECGCVRFRWHLRRRTMYLSICIRAIDVWLHLCNLSLLELLLSFISVCLPYTC